MSKCPTCGGETGGLFGAGEPCVLTFPCVGTGGKTWCLTQAQIDAWQGAYPALDVLQECRGALAWIQSHQERRKTPGGMERMLVGWLNRAVNGGRGAVHSARSSAPVHQPWTCHHLEHCDHRAMCAIKDMNPAKWPTRQAS